MEPFTEDLSGVINNLSKLCGEQEKIIMCGGQKKIINSNKTK